MIAITGPQVGKPECKAMITSTVAIEKWQAQKRRKKMPKRNHEGESLSSASAFSVSSEIQSDSTELPVADANVKTDSPVTNSQSASSESEVDIASAALNLTADVPCHDDTDSDYNSEECWC